MSTWIERLDSLLADNRSAFHRALKNRKPEDWECVLETSKAIKRLLTYQQSNKFGRQAKAEFGNAWLKVSNEFEGRLKTSSAP